VCVCVCVYATLSIRCKLKCVHLACTRLGSPLDQIIASDGELNAAQSLKEAAETIQQSPTALQLRYLQTLKTIAAERGSTILFPIPMDVLGVSLVTALTLA